MPPRSPSRPRGAAAAGAALGHLRRIIHAIHAQSVSIEAATGLSGPQLWALREVAGSNGGLSLSELARALALHKSNAGRLVERLVEKRFVRRHTPADDRRVALVTATAAGRRRAASPVPGPAQADLLSRLSRLPQREMARLERALARLVEILGAGGLEPGPLFDEGRRRPPRRPGRPRAA